MDIRRANYEEGATIKLDIKPILNNAIIGLDDFMFEINKSFPQKFNLYLSSLKKEYEQLMSQEKRSGSFIDYANQVLIEFKNRDEPMKVMDSKFLELSINVFLSILNFDAYKEQHSQKEIEFDTTDTARTMNLFDYYQVSSLLSIMTREEVIKFLDNFMESFLEAMRNPEKYDKNLTAMVDRFSGYDRWRSQDTVTKIINDERVIMRVSRCRWAEVMEGLDPELSYTMLCKRDFKNATIANENFILTRTQTLMEGGDYCDFCYHDTRYDKNLNHPPKQEFDAL